MEQSQLLAIMMIAGTMASAATLLPAKADSQSSEMRELVRQSQGLSPSGAEPNSNAKRIQTSNAPDYAAIYLQAGADAEQAAKIRELRKNLETLNQSKASEMVSLYKELHDLTTQPELDETKILAAQEKINALQATMAMEKTRTLINVRKVLTPKQRENLVTIIKKRTATGQPGMTPSR